MNLNPDDVLAVAHFLYKFREDRFLLGSDKEDFRHAEQIIISMLTEDKMRRK